MCSSDLITLTDKIFQSANGKSLEEAKPYTLHYGEIKDKDGNTIDDVLVSVFRAPHSYTGENSTEISCHGSRYILQQVLHRFTEVGCRQAEPGEYTRRAYLNGKMDLSQAEAVADLIASTNKATHKMALSQLKGHFSNELSLLREKLLKMTSLLELELDFSDHEELEFADRSVLQALAEEINHKITTLAHSFETGNVNFRIQVNPKTGELEQVENLGFTERTDGTLNDGKFWQGQEKGFDHEAIVKASDSTLVITSEGYCRLKEYPVLPTSANAPKISYQQNLWESRWPSSDFYPNYNFESLAFAFDGRERSRRVSSFQSPYLCLSWQP